jgi:hypothetical protein
MPWRLRIGQASVNKSPFGSRAESPLESQPEAAGVAIEDRWGRDLRALESHRFAMLAEELPESGPREMTWWV